MLSLNSSGQLIELELQHYTFHLVYPLFPTRSDVTRVKGQVNDTRLFVPGACTHTCTHTRGDTCGYLSAARIRWHEKDPRNQLLHTNWISELLMWLSVSSVFLEWHNKPRPRCTLIIDSYSSSAVISYRLSTPLTTWHIKESITPYADNTLVVVHHASYTRTCRRACPSSAWLGAINFCNGHLSAYNLRSTVIAVVIFK